MVRTTPNQQCFSPYFEQNGEKLNIVVKTNYFKIVELSYIQLE